MYFFRVHLLTMFTLLRTNKTLLVIAVIAVVNALGYGIIIPILYSYSTKFGLNDFQNGMMFAVFSLCSFLSAPVIGAMSDKYGRKPLLLISLVGTAVSFVMAAVAPNAIWLFLARALDGITAGNIPVAAAVISDTLPPQERGKGFGIISASFNFGFVFGPLISALTSGFGVAVPFWVATAVTIVAIVMTFFMLPETNKHMGEVAKQKLFDFGKLARSLFDKSVGKTLLISLAYSFAFGLFIFSYQPVSVKLLELTPSQISFNFTLFGIIGFLAQAVIIPTIVKRMGDQKALMFALFAAAAAFVGLFLGREMALIFMGVSILLSLANAFIGPMISSLLSREVDAKSQGEIMGVNSSYVSLGMIFGPIVGGVLAGTNLALPFVLGGLITVFCGILAVDVLRKLRVAHLH